MGLKQRAAQAGRWLAGVLFGVLGLTSMAGAQPVAVSSFAEGQGNGVYAFASSTPKTLGELMQGGKEPVNILGHLFLPAGA
ncbi:MAG: hypothetical protein IT498_05515, partial [Rubrivivax sp.]|nr:hypothetical protein [Rubrivivax sp.]